jgi:hypothetical protein
MDSVITIKNDDLIKMTDIQLKKYMGYPFKITWKPNYYVGLRRSLTVNPYMKQEFQPNPDKFYILDRLQSGFIYPRGLNNQYADEIGLYRYWFINAITAGIVHFHNDINRYDIECIHIYKYITPELELALDEKQVTKVDRIRRALLDKYWSNLESLSDELIELVLNYIPIDSVEVFNLEKARRDAGDDVTEDVQTLQYVCKREREHY